MTVTWTWITQPPPARRSNGAIDENAYELPQIRRGRVDRAPRLDLLGSRLAWPSRIDLEHRRRGRHRADDDAELVAAHACRGHAEREVPAARRELLEREALAVGRQRPDVSTIELVRRERRRERPEEELVGGNHTATAHGRCDGRAACRDERERELCRRVRVRDRAAHGSAIPRDRVPDEGEDRGERGVVVQAAVGLPDGRPDDDRVLATFDARRARRRG